MELWPLAHNREAHLKSGRVRRFVQRHAQHWLWWPMTMLFSWSIKVDSVAFLVRSARKNGVTRSWLLDLTMQLPHYALWLVVPSLRDAWRYDAVPVGGAAFAEPPVSQAPGPQSQTSRVEPAQPKPLEVVPALITNAPARSA
ncbi:MAG TPA: hypothetical protein PK095_18215 [Myxococcota bacterium]|nr:hypothetical protein [Myxococcota bacterium]